jgi:hypothetical protein
MTMLIFIDTEFTDLLDPQLLSLAMVTLDGHEFYAELDLDSDLGRERVKLASEFVRHCDVLEQWGAVPGAACAGLELGMRSGNWLIEQARKAGGPVEVAFDYSVDWELLIDALQECGPWEQAGRLVRPVNIAALVATIEGELAAEARLADMRKRGLRRHHALADAQALRAAYEAVKLAHLRR